MTSTEISPGLVIQGFAPPPNSPFKLSDFKLIAFDMDSTLINIECIDEIADAAGRKAEVAAITEAAMRGEITDFKDSLRRRLALLQGVSVASMEAVYAERLLVNPGAKNLIDSCQAAGMKVLLVSGGFTFFADRVQQRLNIDFARSNLLEIVDGKLTGRLMTQAWGEICDGEEKRRMVLATCEALGITPAQAIAMGDGANDLPMMQACADAGGLSVAYHAKPKVREQAMVAINTGGLDRLLEVLK
jgi:phosphoserine phosphatase